MRDDEHRPPLPHPPQRRQNPLLGRGVHSAERVIHDQNRRTAHERPLGRKRTSVPHHLISLRGCSLRLLISDSVPYGPRLGAAVPQPERRSCHSRRAPRTTTDPKLAVLDRSEDSTLSPSPRGAERSWRLALSFAVILVPQPSSGPRSASRHAPVFSVVEASIPEIQAAQRRDQDEQVQPRIRQHYVVRGAGRVGRVGPSHPLRNERAWLPRRHRVRHRADRRAGVAGHREFREVR